MDLPALVLLAVTLSEDLTFTLSFGVLVAGGLLTWAETRFQVTGLRESNKGLLERVTALETRVASAEVREGRLVERFESLVTRLDRMEQKLDRILETQRQAA